MKFIVAVLSLLLLSAATDACSVEFGGRHEAERRSVERAREVRDAQDRSLTTPEGKDWNSQKELYVAKARVTQTIREALFRQESTRQNAVESRADAAETQEGYSAVYFDAATYLEVTNRTIQENSAAVEAFQQDSSRTKLEIVVRDHGKPVGEVLPENVGQLKPRDRKTEVSRGSVVQLVKVDRDHYYIARSHPLYERRLDYSKDYNEDLKDFDFGHKSFSGKLDRDLILIQFHKFGEPIAQEGKQGRTAKWWTTPEQAQTFKSVDDLMERLAFVPGWGERDGISIAFIPKGTYVEYERGIAGRQHEDNALTKERRWIEGGGIQYRFKSFDRTWIYPKEIKIAKP